MLVRDAGDAWQIVLQTDHADLSAQLAAAWGGPGFARPEPYEPLLRAARRHDDGWATWEQQPRLGDDGAPQSFVTVPAPVHLAFYRAGVECVAEEDAAAGLLVSMHMSGLYRQRYDVMPSPVRELDEEVRDIVDAFVEQEEDRQVALRRMLDVDEAWRWTSYALLQVFDVVSLYLGLANVETGVAGGCDGVPTADGEDPVRMAIEPLGPWRVRFDPYPFVEDQIPLTMRRRLVRKPKQGWPDDDAFRADLAATPFETVRIFAQR
ncbi:MAG TPA: DUF3891 family protein [Conexibacter sp.]|jgi:hypothetical protein|nr:DUF3891 family protein [Conexibacter sp.]